jgi:tRNA (mo5U34)-methyltransferase
MPFPTTFDEFLEQARRFARRLEVDKRELEVPDYGWYPYQSLATLDIVAGLLRDDFDELRDLLQTAPAADVGCGDGDYAFLLDSLGVGTDAVDHQETNFNQMRGLAVLKRRFDAATQIFDLDFDARFELPRSSYGLIVFLGTLYHLKNPFYILEMFAKSSAYCIVSTRIAQKTPAGARIEDEPVGYLLDAHEANNDPTNYWIFSRTGLARLVERAGWTIRAEQRLGALEDSNPVDSHADERIFLLLKSRFRYPELEAWPLAGWHAVENDSWRWTAKRFRLGVLLPVHEHAAWFALRFVLPEIVFEQAPGPVSMTCRIGEQPCGSIRCDGPGSVEFRGSFPEGLAPGARCELEFEVASEFRASGSDERDLGVIVPLLDADQRATRRIPFRVA